MSASPGSIYLPDYQTIVNQFLLHHPYQGAAAAQTTTTGALAAAASASSAPAGGEDMTAAYAAGIQRHQGEQTWL